MSDMTAVVDSYLGAYGETDSARRRTLIEQSWSPTGTLVDPPLEATGHADLDAMFVAVQGQFPGHTFRRTTVIDTHHGKGRYGWDLISPTGSVTLAGTDFVHFGDDGRLVYTTGFFGPLAPSDG